MRNTLLILLLWPALSMADFDIKSNLILPKQMDSHVRFQFINLSKDRNLYSGSTQTVRGERSEDKISGEFRFGLFDDLALVLKFNKITTKLKEEYLTQSKTEERKWSGLSDPSFGVIARIKNGSEGTTYFDAHLNFSPGIMTREYPTPKVLSNAAPAVGKPGNNANGGHIIDGGITFGKPMTDGWEWIGKLFYTINFKADELDVSNDSRSKIDAFSSYYVSFTAQKYLQENQHAVWAELSYQQKGSYKKRDVSGNSQEQLPSETIYNLNIGFKTSLFWKTFYGGIYGGYGVQADIEGITNSTSVWIKDQNPKTIGIEFLTKI